MKKLGKIETDYILDTPLDHFDNYGRYDIMGIEYDLRMILTECHWLTEEEKAFAKKRYDKVIDYIKKKMIEREEI